MLYARREKDRGGNSSPPPPPPPSVVGFHFAMAAPPPSIRRRRWHPRIGDAAYALVCVCVCASQSASQPNHVCCVRRGGGGGGGEGEGEEEEDTFAKRVFSTESSCAVAVGLCGQEGEERVGRRKKQVLEKKTQRNQLLTTVDRQRRDASMKWTLVVSCLHSLYVRTV